MVLRIVDEKVSKKVTEENLLELKTFGKNSTVYDSSYSSAITPKLASQIVIATQAATKGGIKDFPEDVLSYVKNKLMLLNFYQIRNLIYLKSYQMN